MSMSGSPMQSIYEEDLEVTLSLKGQVKFLMGAFSRLNESQEETNSTVATMEGKMSSMESAMTNLTSAVHAMMKAVRKMPVQEMDQFSDSSNPTSQVHRPNLEHNRSVSMGFRAEELNLENCASMLKKVEMPFCDGSKVSEWIVDIEYFNTLGHYGDEAKLDLVPLCLQGALKNMS